MTLPEFHHRSHGINLNKQRGVSLLVGIMLLSVLAIMTVSAVTVGILQEKMAGNMRDQALAFQNAESALSESLTAVTATLGISGYAVQFEHSCNAPVDGYCRGATADTLWTGITESNWADDGVTKSTTQGARYIVMLDTSNESNADANLVDDSSKFKSYRILVRAPGFSGNNFVYVDSVFRFKPSV